MKLKKSLLVLSLLAGSTVFVSCKHEDSGRHHFENRIYFTTSPITDDLLIKPEEPETSEATRTVSSQLSMPAVQDITVNVDARPTEAAVYNLIYGDNAIALSEEHFDIPAKTFTIHKGDITGEDIVIHFKALDELDSKYRYVLPVTIASAEGVEVLESRRTVYFIVKRGALINVVANISEMYFSVKWSEKSKDIISNMQVITVEALVRSSDWVADRSNPLSSVFGIENNFLIRIGDSDRSRDQLQLVAPGGNFPNPDEAPGLPVNEWVHIAIVWDATTKERIYYQNGEIVASDKGVVGSSINLSDNCYVGRSYDETRWLPGEISELRIWSIKRTQEEIASNLYYVNPSTPSLVAYWKFNEGEGNVIKDVTGNGTDLTGSDQPTWISVEIPSQQ